MDSELSIYRSRYHFPKHKGEDCLYFCGNSLGLQPKSTKAALIAELDHWAAHGVEGHFTGDNAWMYYHKLLTPASARLVGARDSEVKFHGFDPGEDAIVEVKARPGEDYIRTEDIEETIKRIQIVWFSVV
ncbi:unnamed protein product [Bathycoccus prasinos]